VLAWIEEKKGIKVLVVVVEQEEKGKG